MTTPELTEVQKDVTVVFHHRLRTRLWCSRLHKALPDGRAWRYLWPMRLRPTRKEVYAWMTDHQEAR